MLLIFNESYKIITLNRLKVHINSKLNLQYFLKPHLTSLWTNKIRQYLSKAIFIRQHGSNSQQNGKVKWIQTRY